jgi:hypothetical protein
VTTEPTTGDARLWAATYATLGTSVAKGSRLQARLDAVLALHKPERRYTFGDAGYSCLTKRDAAEVFEVSFDRIEHFDICAHCGDIEMAEGCEHDYKESLWPCATAKAAGVEGGVG